MIKLTIPVILAATIVVAGLFAFAPVEQASTVHETVATSISGAQTIVSQSVTSFDLSATAGGFGDADREYHQFVLTSEVPFTIHDIEVTATMTGSTTDASDDMRVRAIAYPAEYGSAATDENGGGPESDRRDSTSDDMFGSDTILDGNDSLDTLTWSMSAENADDNNGLFSFTENTNVLFQLTFLESGFDDTVDFTADVTFYLSGAAQDDVELFLDEDVVSGDQIQ